MAFPRYDDHGTPAAPAQHPRRADATCRGIVVFVPAPRLPAHARARARARALLPPPPPARAATDIVEREDGGQVTAVGARSVTVYGRDFRQDDKARELAYACVHVCATPHA